VQAELLVIADGSQKNDDVCRHRRRLACVTALVGSCLAKPFAMRRCRASTSIHFTSLHVLVNFYLSSNCQEITVTGRRRRASIGYVVTQEYQRRGHTQADTMFVLCTDETRSAAPAGMVCSPMVSGIVRDATLGLFPVVEIFHAMAIIEVGTFRFQSLHPCNTTIVSRSKAFPVWIHCNEQQRQDPDAGAESGESSSVGSGLVSDADSVGCVASTVRGFSVGRARSPNWP